MRYKVPTYDDLNEYRKSAKYEHYSHPYVYTKSLVSEVGVSFIENRSSRMTFKNRDGQQNEPICSPYEIKQIPNTDHSWVMVSVMEVGTMTERRFTSFIIFFEDYQPVSVCEATLDMIHFEDFIIIWDPRGHSKVRMLNMMTNEIISYDFQSQIRYSGKAKFELPGFEFIYVIKRFDLNHSIICIDKASGWTEEYEGSSFKKPAKPFRKYFQGER